VNHQRPAVDLNGYFSSAPPSRMRVSLADQADVAALLGTLDGAVSQTMQVRATRHPAV
jgi:hypothetical protein